MILRAVVLGRDRRLHYYTFAVATSLFWEEEGRRFAERHFALGGKVIEVLK